MEDEFLVGILLIFSGFGLSHAHVGQGKEVTNSDTTDTDIHLILGVGGVKGPPKSRA